MGPSDFPQGRPFEETLAVQVLSVGPPPGWQVNVACKGAERPRLQLGEYPDRDTALPIARAVADFVGVPLVEQAAAAASDNHVGETPSSPEQQGRQAG
jgi:hypothetical protein